jgi:serine/threonine protein kinase
LCEEDSPLGTGEVLLTFCPLPPPSPSLRCINKYLIIRELGRGSFGGVYLVRDEETDKLHAMKVISK